MDYFGILNSVNSVLWHNAQGALESLISTGDAAVPRIESRVLEYAAGAGGFTGSSDWWDGACALCIALSRIGTRRAREALLTILKTDSHVVEFDLVRTAAAQQLATFRDCAEEVIPELMNALDSPHAPLLEIRSAVEALGGQMPLTPELVIEKGRQLQPRDAIEYFSTFQQQATTWTKNQQRYFYHSLASKIYAAFADSGPQADHQTALQLSRPYYAAALLADPNPNAAAWDKFDETKKTETTAQKLAKKFPLPVHVPVPPIVLEIEADTLDEAREQLKPHLLKGFEVVSEHIIAHGLPETIQALGDTLRDALAEAHKSVPLDSVVIECEEIQPEPTQREVTVEAFDEQNARWQAELSAKQSAMHKLAIQDIALIASGKKGLLGLRNKPNQYKIRYSFCEPASVKITYKRQARIEVKLEQKR